MTTETATSASSAGSDRDEAEHLAVTIVALNRAGEMTVEEVEGGLRITIAHSLSIPLQMIDARHPSQSAAR